MYKKCIENGVYVANFWDMTAGEILDYFKAFANRENNNYKMQAVMCYKLGRLVSIGFNQPQKFPDMGVVFPDLFEEDKSKKQDWRIMKERIMRYGEMKRLKK